MIQTKGILHFSLPVSDLERSKKFFMDLLGCELVTQSPIMVFLKSGDDYFILVLSKKPIDPNVPGDVRVHHAFMVDHDKYDATMATVTEAGIDIIRDEYRDTGAFTGRQFYFLDPDGNAIELIAFDGPGPGFQG